MSANWFAGCRTVAEIKSRYRQLAKEHHPDHGGNTATMQDINAQYHAALQNADGFTTTDAEGKTHTYHYQPAVEQAIMDKINELLHLKMLNVEVELIGWWVWIHGNTRPYAKLLRAANCEWHNKRQMWYWRQIRSHYTGRDFDTLRAYYGSQTFHPAPEDQPAPAPQLA